MGIYDELSKLDTLSPTAPEPSVSQGPLPQKPARKAAPKVTPTSKSTREKARAVSRDPSRGKTRKLPSRDAIQGFSFQLRDELKVKVQAEVPHGWQRELEDMARALNVKKLELYRWIIGEFLGKVEETRHD